jgi:hypothetical protein
VASGDVGKGKRKEAPTPEQVFLLIIYSNSLTCTKFARSAEKVQVKGAHCRGDSGRTPSAQRSRSTSSVMSVD